jgi:hypothetical protein
LGRDLRDPSFVSSPQIVDRQGSPSISRRQWTFLQPCKPSWLTAPAGSKSSSGRFRAPDRASARQEWTQRASIGPMCSSAEACIRRRRTRLTSPGRGRRRVVAAGGDVEGWLARDVCALVAAAAIQNSVSLQPEPACQSRGV